MRTLPNIVVSIALLFLCSSALADNKSIQGTVTGTDGKPLADAEVRVERLDAKAAPALTKTDAKGQYAFKRLPAGAYAITAVVKSVPKSRATVRTRNDGWVRVDFDLRMAANGKNIARKPSTSRTNTMESDNLSRLQGRLGGNINNMSFPGH
jgi:Carboxypeptidase regulatory-like domain